MRTTRVLFILILVLAACTARQPSASVATAANIQQMRFHCSDDTTRINQLLQAGADAGITDVNALVAFYARQLLETPYVAHTLEDQNREWLTINIHELDCTTFVETLYALARTTATGRTSWRDYAANLESIRYRGGVMGDYSSRLHYISEWIVDNRSRGNVQEITSDMPHANHMVKNIDFMSTHRDRYPQIATNDTLYNKIRNFEAGFRNHRIPYLKKSWTGDKAVKQLLREGDIIGMVTTAQGLDVSHLGIVVFDDKGEPHMLDASSLGGKVQIEDQPLVKYLSKSKSCIGIRVFRMLP